MGSGSEESGGYNAELHRKWPLIRNSLAYNEYLDKHIT